MNAMTNRRLELDALKVAQAIKGDEEAWKAIYADVRPFVVGLCVRDFGLCPEDARDVSHDVMYLFVKHLPRIENPGAWLYKTAMTRAADFRPRGPLGTPKGEESCSDESVEEAASIWHLFGGLSARCRKIIRYILLEERPHREVAGLLGIPEGSIHHYKTKCMKQVLHYYAGGGYEP
jgi:RNA polymerase sigma factor (sigma-70 family)